MPVSSGDGSRLKLLLLEGVKVHLMLLSRGHRRGLWPLVTGYRHEGDSWTIPAYLLREPRRLAEEVGWRNRGLEWDRVLGVSTLRLGLYGNSRGLSLLRGLLRLNSNGLLWHSGWLCLRLWLRLG